MCVCSFQELTNLGKPKRPRTAFNIFMSEHFEEARGTTTQVSNHSTDTKCFLIFCAEMRLTGLGDEAESSQVVVSEGVRDSPSGL